MVEKTEEQKKADYAARVAKSRATRAANKAKKAAESKEVSVMTDVIDLQVEQEVDLNIDMLVKPGDKIFLRYRSGPVVMVGNLRLSCMTQETIIPENISGDDLMAIDGHVRNGTICIGEIEHEQHQAQTQKELDNDVSSGEEYVKDWYIKQLDDAGKTREAVVGLSKAGRFISGWHPKDLLAAMNRAETEDKNRPSVISFITEAIRTLRSVSIASEDFNPKKHASSTTHWDNRKFHTPRTK